MRRQPRWMQALGNTRNGLFVVDGSQRVLAWNSAAERVLGYAAADVVGRHCYDVIAGRVASGGPWCRPGCGVQRSIRQGALPPSFDIAVLTKDRRTIWLDVACVVLPRHPVPFVGHLLRDITEEKREEEELDKIRAILAVAGVDRPLAGVPSRLSDERQPAPSARNAQPAEGPDAPDLTRRVATLTARERTVVRLLADGLPGKAIAERLGISLLTVRSHVANVLRKLGVHRQAAAVAVALREDTR